MPSLEGGTRTRLTVADRIEPGRGLPGRQDDWPDLPRPATSRRKCTSRPTAARQRPTRVTTSPTEEWRVAALARSAGDHVPIARRQDAVRAAVHAGDGRGQAAMPRARPCCSCTAPAICRMPTGTGRPTTASTCSTTCSRRAATWSSTWTTAPARDTGATGVPPSTATWAARISRTSSTAPGTWRRRRRSIRSGLASTVAATAGSSR